jgi:hypothetical protein
MCGELVTKGGRGGQTELAGRRRKRLRFCCPGSTCSGGTLRTRAGWGSADSATPRARCLSTFQSPGKTSHVGRGLPGNEGGRERFPNGPA